MDKKIDNPTNEEEYQFQEPESETHFSATNNSSGSTSLFERINRQHIIAGFIFIFLVYGAYKLVNHLFHAVLMKQQAIEKVQKLAATRTPVNNNLDAKADTERNRLDHLAQGQLDVQSAIRSLDSEISDVQASLASVNNQLVQVNDEIQSLNTGQEFLIQKQTKPIRKAEEKKKETPKAIYYVRAMIPGRVWLTTQEGSTLTLGIGDKLTGYGIIDAINPDQGIITLSSGAVIGYNPDDR